MVFCLIYKTKNNNTAKQMRSCCSLHFHFNRDTHKHLLQLSYNAPLCCDPLASQIIVAYFQKKLQNRVFTFNCTALDLGDSSWLQSSGCWEKKWRMKHNKRRIEKEGQSQTRRVGKNKERTHKVPNVSKSEGGVGERKEQMTKRNLALRRRKGCWVAMETHSKHH